ncbi:MAG: hypothetical protein EBW49_03600 [Betaproteobacteria bacterium]|nr:hypothetical protein [Betaproteobacteria bacterium]NDG15703.1 hypothetical protein [Betaproteobacteria bacterium]
MAVSTAQASPFLRCEVTYAGATQVVHATPVADPYEVAPVDIAERFLFKVVMTATRGRLDHVLIYTYLQQDPRPVLLQQAKYFAPFKPSRQPVLLTGEQHIYGGPIERELIYRCWLGGIQP